MEQPYHSNYSTYGSGIQPDFATRNKKSGILPSLPKHEDTSTVSRDTFSSEGVGTLLGFFSRLRISHRSIIIYSQFVVIPFLLFAAWAVLPVQTWWEFLLPAFLYHVFLLLRWMAFFDMILPGLPLRYVLSAVYLFILSLLVLFVVLIALEWQSVKLAHSLAAILELLFSSGLFMIHVIRQRGFRIKNLFSRGPVWTELESESHGQAMHEIGVRRTASRSPLRARAASDVNYWGRSTPNGSFADIDVYTRPEPPPMAKWKRILLSPFRLLSGHGNDPSVIEDMAVEGDTDVRIRVSDDILVRHVFADHELLIASLYSTKIISDYHQEEELGLDDADSSDELADRRSKSRPMAKKGRKLVEFTSDGLQNWDASKNTPGSVASNLGSHTEDDHDSLDMSSHVRAAAPGNMEPNRDAARNEIVEFETDGHGEAGLDGIGHSEEDDKFENDVDYDDEDDDDIRHWAEDLGVVDSRVRADLVMNDDVSKKRWKSGRLARMVGGLSEAGVKVTRKTLQMYEPPDDLSQRLKLSRVRDKHCSKWFYNIFCYVPLIDGQRLMLSTFASSRLELRWRTLIFGVLFKVVMSALLILLQLFTFFVFSEYKFISEYQSTMLATILVFQIFRVISFNLMFWMNKKLPQIQEVKYFSQFIVPLLFYLYYRNLFILISKWWSVVAVSVWTFLVNLVLYPVMMSGWVYWVRFVWLRRQLLHYIPPLGRFIYDEDIPYEKYVIDLTVEYYYDNIAEYSSYLIFMLAVSFLRYGYNAGANPLLVQILTDDAFTALMLRSTYYVATEFVGDLVIRFICYYFLKLNVSNKGRNLTVLNYRTRFLFALFFAGILMDVYYGLTGIPSQS